MTAPSIADRAALIEAYEAADRAARSHLWPGGCRDCTGGYVCPAYKRLLRRADELGEQRWRVPAAPVDEVRRRVMPEVGEPAADEYDSYGLGGFVVVVVSALSGCLLFGLPLLMLLWPSAIPMMGR